MYSSFVWAISFFQHHWRGHIVPVSVMLSAVYREKWHTSCKSTRPSDSTVEAGAVNRAISKFIMSFMCTIPCPVLWVPSWRRQQWQLIRGWLLASSLPVTLLQFDVKQYPLCAHSVTKSTKTWYKVYYSSSVTCVYTIKHASIHASVCSHIDNVYTVCTHRKGWNSMNMFCEPFDALLWDMTHQLALHCLFHLHYRQWCSTFIIHNIITDVWRGTHFDFSLHMCVCVCVCLYVCVCVCESEMGHV